MLLQKLVAASRGDLVEEVLGGGGVVAKGIFARGYSG
jgi:hypothetical protein